MLRRARSHSSPMIFMVMLKVSSTLGSEELILRWTISSSLPFTEDTGG